MNAARKTCKLREVEVYSLLFYNEKIGPRVSKERGDTSLSHSENLSLVKRVTADMYVDETEQVKVMVAAKIAEASEKPVEKEKESDEPSCIPGANRAPSDFQW
jgi:hypothetical protein